MGVVKEGPSGGHFDPNSFPASYIEMDIDPEQNEVNRVTKLIIGHTETSLKSLYFAYQKNDDVHGESDVWGDVETGSKTHIYLLPDEYITRVSGHFTDRIQSITIHTNFHDGLGAYGPFGNTEGTKFNYTARRGERIVGFHGAAGDECIKFLGVYVLEAAGSS